MAAGVLAALAAPALHAADTGDGAFWLGYHHSRDAQKQLRYLSGQSLQTSAETPAGLTLPDGAGERPHFAKWSTPMDPAGFRRVALARSEASDLCDQLIIDTNGDGRLDDEAIHPPHHMRPYGMARGQVYFGPIEMRFDSPDGPILYHLNFTIYCGGVDEYHVQAMAGGWYQGTVMLGGKATDCQLIDYNANGAFNDTCDGGSGYASADRVRFTTDAGVEPVFAGRYIRAGERLYEFGAARDGAFVTIREADDVAVGTLAPPDDFMMVKVYGPQGSFTVRADGIRDVPVGVYRFESWQREVTAGSGLAWRFTGRGFPQDATLDVAENEQVALELSDPWTGKLEDRAFGSRRHSIEQVLIGRYGERIDASYANGRRVPAPRLKIANADASYDRTFKFEYG